jgi:hypothetical protein
MAALLLVAYAVGEAIRFNIKHFEPIANEGHGPAGPAQRVENELGTEILRRAVRQNGL